MSGENGAADPQEHQNGDDEAERLKMRPVEIDAVSPFNYLSIISHAHYIVRKSTSQPTRAFCERSEPKKDIATVQSLERFNNNPEL